MRDLARQAVQALRSWSRTPTLTAVALATLALGIGANTALFSILQGVVLSPLPYPDSEDIVRVWEGRPVSSEIFATIDDGVATEASESPFAALSIYGNASLILDTPGGPESLRAGLVSGGHFAVLGVEPALGRGFVDAEHHPGGDAVVVVSHHFWQQQLGGSATVLGTTVDLDGTPRTVVGVMPESHHPLSASWQLWLPLVIDTASEQHTDWLSYLMLGRLADGATPQIAQRATEAALAPLREKYPDRDSLAQAVPVVPLRDVLVGDSGAMLWLLFAAVVAVLLIACTNVANLLLARIGGRRQELALRSALGASRRRLVVHLLAESLVLALVGGLLGLLVASWTLAALEGPLTAELPRAEGIAIDSRVLVFNLVASLLAGLLFGLLPALRASGRSSGDALRSASRDRSPGRSQHRLGGGLVAAEVALAVVLVSGAGLLFKSFWNLHQVDPGFDSSQTTTLRVQPPANRYDDAARSRFFVQVEERLATLPGVDAIGGINLLPMTSGNLFVSYRHPGMPASESARPVSVRIVTPEYFPTIRVEPVEGRTLVAGDRADGEAVGLINETLARQLRADDPTREVLGAEIQFTPEDPWFRVVGVIPDLRQRELDSAPGPTVYRPLSQETWDTQMTYTLRTAGPPPSLRQLRRAVAEVDPGVPVSDVATFDAVIAASLGDDRRLVTLFGIFAALALVLGGLGVYGVTTHAVAQRRHEHGVRLALGARGLDVIRGALARALTPVAIGLLVGLVAALVAGPLLGRWLFEVEARDPMVLGGVLLFLTGCATLAGYLPARRAARVDPMVILGSD